MRGKVTHIGSSGDLSAETQAVHTRPAGQELRLLADFSSDWAGEYARKYLAGKFFGRSMSDRDLYFAWHRGNRFCGETT
jgi:hypothetical protein